MEFYGDYHLHTKYSDGRATVEEMVEAAHIKGLKEVAITDHGPKNIGTGVKNSASYLQIKAETRALREVYPDLKILVGAEANIIGLNGELDINQEVIEELDFLMVGLHPYVMPKNLGTAWNFVLGNQLVKINKGLKEKVRNINTKTLKEALYKHDVLAITHPGLKMNVDNKELARACVKKGTAFEINTGHNFPGAREVWEVAPTGVNFIVNSDAHFPETVGEFDFGSYVLEKAQIPPERVLNASTKWAINTLGRRFCVRH